MAMILPQLIQIRRNDPSAAPLIKHIQYMVDRPNLRNGIYRHSHQANARRQRRQFQRCITQRWFIRTSAILALSPIDQQGSQIGRIDKLCQIVPWLRFATLRGLFVAPCCARWVFVALILGPAHRPGFREIASAIPQVDRLSAWSLVLTTGRSTDLSAR